jgi:hypothetical protein
MRGARERNLTRSGGNPTQTMKGVPLDVAQSRQQQPADQMGVPETS